MRRYSGTSIAGTMAQGSSAIANVPGPSEKTQADAITDVQDSLIEEPLEIHADGG